MLGKFDPARFEQVMAGFEPADNFERELALGILQHHHQKERYKETEQQVELVIRKTANDRSVSS